MRKILIVIIVIVILAGVFGAGILFGKQITAPDLAKAKKLLNSLTSETLQAIVAVGEVSNISGRTVTLTNIGKSLNVSIRDDAQIIKFVKRGNDIVQQEIQFQDIKKGDYLNVDAKILPSGEVEGTAVKIYPLVKIPTSSK